MFHKIIIAEDYQSTNLSIQKALSDLQIHQTQYTTYCDEAYKKIYEAIAAKQPYEVLVTDLSFDEDENIQNLKSGFELIKAVKRLRPETKIVVFSAEKKDGIIHNLFQEYGINAFVHKGRNDMNELKIAFEKIYLDENYISSETRNSFQKMNSYEFSKYDIALVEHLSQGILQKDLPAIFVKKNLKPNSLSSIEKRLNIIRHSLKLSNNEQLISFCKDLGII
ncbi:MAG: response regulator [Bacteroidetes bacterium]|nr:response regulator [Bacteroidota bacterium]